MTSFDLIEVLVNGGEVPPGTLNNLIACGILPLSFKTHINIYKCFVRNYTNRIDAGDKSPIVTAVVMTSEDCAVSEATVYRAVKRIESLSE